MVNSENYEEYLMLYADGELDEAGTQELMAFVAAHPGVEQELKAYASARFVPDQAIVYTEKESLLKLVPQKRVIALTPRTMAAAAGLLLAIGFAALWWYRPAGKDSSSNPPAVAATNIPPIKSRTDFPPAPHRDTQHKVPVNHRPMRPSPQRSSVMAVPADRIAAVPHSENENRTDTQLPALNTASAHEVAVAVALPQASPAIITAADQPRPATASKDNLAWLPVSQESKEGMSIIGEAINERVAQVKKIKNSLKETALSVNIGKKGITINF